MQTCRASLNPVPCHGRARHRLVRVLRSSLVAAWAVKRRSNRRSNLADIGLLTLALIDAGDDSRRLAQRDEQLRAERRQRRRQGRCASGERRAPARGGG
jgi:hypothetical protein